MTRMLRRYVLLALIAPLHACAAGDTISSEVVARDSAGIAIVENGAAAPKRTLTVPDEPDLEIGSIEGPAEYQLHNVDHVVALSDGTVAVSQAGTEVRYYDASGQYLRTAGREGSGPGEFRRITYMRRLNGDSLLIFDSPGRRVTVLAPDGEYVRDFPPPSSSDRPALVAGALRDGTLLTRVGTGFPSRSQEMYRDTAQYAVVNGDSIALIGTYPGSETGLNINQSGGAITSIEIRRLSFARANHASAGAERFYVGSSDTYEIHEWDSAGGLTRIIRSAHVPPQPVTEELLEAWIDEMVDASARNAGEQGREFDEAALRRRLASQPSAPSVPMYAAFVAAQDGGVWVQDYTLPGTDTSDGSERWTIFDADGRITGVIDLPPQFRPMHITSDRVTGVITDELDVEYVRVYSLDG